MPVRPTQALVTGGSGFIGSHLVDLLLDEGVHVTVVDDLSTGVRENLPDAHPHLRFIEAKVTDALPDLDGSFDHVYHLAASVGVRRVIEDPIGSIETNVGETASILRYVAALASPESPVSILIASSSEVYGKSTKDRFQESDDAVYGPTTIRRWSYAYGKALDEHLALAHHDERGSSGLRVVVARFFNTVGPRQRGEYGMVLPRFVRAALQGETLPVHGDGTQSRCFCDVRDVVRALPSLVTVPACAGGVFNVGADTPITIGDLARLVVTSLDSTSSIETIPYGEVFRTGFEDLQQRRPDLTRIREAIGYETRYSLEATIRDVARTMQA